MVLNVIDFNNALKENQRNLYCIYRNLELGHEVHIYDENSKLFKYLLSSKDFNKVREALIYNYFSPFYEFLKLFLMKSVEGWFIEQDMIVYSSCDIQKTSPCISDSLSNGSFIYKVFSFCTWMPIYIKHDSLTMTFLENSFKNLKLFLGCDFPHGGDEESYQTFALVKTSKNDDHKYQEFLKKFNFSQEKPIFIHFCESQTSVLENFIIINDEMSKDVEGIKQSNIKYEDLLKFNTFKIMP